MARASFSSPNPAQVQAPDSPRSSESPVPAGIQGDLEQELLGLANALYNLGTTVVSDLTKDKDKPGGGGKQVGMRVCVGAPLTPDHVLTRTAETMSLDICHPLTRYHNTYPP